MRVHGYVVPLEDDDGRVEGVLGAEVEGQQERLTLVQRVRGAAHVDRPTERAEQTFLQVVGLRDVPSELRLGFVDLNFECSNVCPNLLGLMRIWHKRLGSWARWWNTEIKVNQTQSARRWVTLYRDPLGCEIEHNLGMGPPFCFAQ